MGGSTNNVIGSRYCGGYAEVTDLIGLGSGSASTLMARSFSGASNTKAEVKRWKALRDALHHHSGHASERLRANFSSICGISHTGSFDVQPAYKPRMPLRTPKDFERLGLRAEEAAVFRALAVEYKWQIFVRSGTSARTSNVGLPGLRPKPGGLYQKTSKESYLFGLVLFTAGERQKSEGDIARQASANEKVHLRKLSESVYAIRDKDGNFFMSDVDIQGVYAQLADGTWAKVPADVYVRLFNEHLLATGLHGPHLLENGTAMNEKPYGVRPFSPIQHPAHDDWIERNNPDYAGGVNMGPLPGVIHFSPEAVPYHIETVPEYRDCLNGMGLGGVYRRRSWEEGRNRLPTAGQYRPYKFSEL